MKIVASICASLLCCCAPTLAQGAIEPEVVVQRLADESTRAAAREQLIALGAAAVPALAAGLSTASNRLLGEMLAILTELGPKAVGAMPHLRALMAGENDLVVEVLATIGELAPWCEAGTDPTEQSQLWMRLMFRMSCDPSSTSALAHQRYLERAAFPREASLETLLRYAKGFKPLQVELAIEHLGQRGAAAHAALPRLRELLERPEPRILTTDRTVPLHRKAAIAVLSIAPEGELAAVAREVLSCKRPPPVLAPRPTPDRLQQRVDELVAELALPAKRKAAHANLVALGQPSAVPVGRLLAGGGDAETIDAALAVLRDLGSRGADAVPHLVDAMLALPAVHTIAVMGTLEVTAPWAADLIPPLVSSGGVGEFRLFGHLLTGTIDAQFMTDATAATMRLSAALQVDPSAALPELETLLQDPSVLVREFALTVLIDRAAAARPLVPAIAAMLERSAPMCHQTVWLNAGRVTVRQVDRTPFIHRLAARAIVAAAAPDDPNLARAQAVLAEPEPK